MYSAGRYKEEFKILASYAAVEILIKNQNFGRKSKLWSKIEILVENRNFAQRSKY